MNQPMFIKIQELVDSGEAAIQTGPFGTQLKASDYTHSGVPVINVRNIGFGDVRANNLEYLGEAKASQLSAHRIRKNDIVFGRKGAVERHAFIDDNSDNWIQGSDCLRLRVTSTSYHNRFLSYYFQTPFHQNWMIAVCSFGATMTSLNQNIVRRIEIPKIPYTTQKKIAATLSAYDDLIENNNRRIVLLEKAAEELYKEWFVRMRFPGYESAKFEKGIPKGWEVKKVGDVVDRKRFGITFKEEQLRQDGSIPVIDQSTSEYLGFYDGVPSHIASIEKPIIIFGDHSCKMQLMIESFSLGENVIPFKAIEPMPELFLFYLVHNLAETTEYKRHWGTLISKDVYAPSEILQIQFDNRVKPAILQREKLRKINRLLRTTRDRLLTRLISGKLSVEDLNIKFPKGMEE